MSALSAAFYGKGLYRPDEAAAEDNGASSLAVLNRFGANDFERREKPTLRCERVTCERCSCPMRGGWGVTDGEQVRSRCEGVLENWINVEPYPGQLPLSKLSCAM
ncbi:sushi repeat-containing protein SRPX-like protein [Anopheles sinensis]|uniref:Sushi repeat-containing protein SRPX-like protein n=1 Tax=Anopheles sinensis TaxID=74873 RepID=A0A084W9H0_ANOSI|nr:sushi repeat-containing protein SRPX-like protein [Anopheles sinensis]